MKFDAETGRWHVEVGGALQALKPGNLIALTVVPKANSEQVRITSIHTAQKMNKSSSKQEPLLKVNHIDTYQQLAEIERQREKLKEIWSKYQELQEKEDVGNI